MGLLDEILGGMVQGGLGQSMGQQPPQPRGGGMPGMGGGTSSILMALLPVVLAMMAGRQGGGGQGAGTGGMGDLGGLLGSVLGGGGGGAGGMGGMGGMGGLGGLLEQFQRMGYGDQANSWVGTGQNLPISPEVIAQVFGRDGLSQIAAQAGLSEAETSAGLSELLPGVVDKLTPQGQMPDLDVLAQSVADLQRRLG
jgi:uncharacterized protein YidB (DUF937 family)